MECSPSPEYPDSMCSICEDDFCQLVDLPRLRHLDLDLSDLSDLSDPSERKSVTGAVRCMHLLTTLKITNGHGDIIQGQIMNKLEKLTFEQPEGIIYLSTLHKLTTLCIYNGDLTHLNGLLGSMFKNLKTIVINSCHQLTDVNALGIKKMFPVLSHLDLTDCRLENIEWITELAKTLKYLKLRSNSLTSIRGLVGFDQLTHLDLSGNVLSRLDSLANAGLRNLVCLDVSNNPFLTDVSGLATAGLESLLELDLSSNIALANVDSLKRVELNNLTKLNLSGNTILCNVQDILNSGLTNLLELDVTSTPSSIGVVRTGLAIKCSVWYPEAGEDVLYITRDKCNLPAKVAKVHKDALPQDWHYSVIVEGIGEKNTVLHRLLQVK
jgi:hypothetical protein